MNLFDLDASYFSHPDHPFRDHISNIAASFKDHDHEIAAEFHDFGKLSDEFQHYIATWGQGPKTKHATLGAFYFLLTSRLRIDKKTFAIFLSILKHHGDLPNVDDYVLNTFDDDEMIEDDFERITAICNNIESRSTFKHDADDLIELFDEEEFTACRNLKGLDSYFGVKAVFSKLIFADKYEAIFKTQYHENPALEAGHYIDKLSRHLSVKQNPMAMVRNMARKEIIANYRSVTQKRIFIIEAPTGVGKTFTALHLALEIAKDKHKKRIINALPMTSIIDQTYEEYSKIIDVQTLLKFHYLTNAKSYDENIQETEQAGDQATKLNRQKNDYITASWSGDAVVITTFNQLFYAIYSNKNRDLIKFHTLRDAVVILDEIQSIPRILLKDVANTLSFLAQQFNIDFILMSATIPAIKNFLPQSNCADLLDNSYYEMEFNNRYTIHFEDHINSMNILAHEVAKAAEINRSVLCVVNTKRLALELFEKLENNYEKDEIFILSTNHIPLHRKEIVAAIKTRLDGGQKTVLISTQVVEAGVDLDFDIGFREFAPFSSIIQTAGRVNREGQKPNSRIIITDIIGKSPYDKKDVLYEDVKEMLKTQSVSENAILPVLREYFQIAIEKTAKEYQLLNEMKNLNFETVFDKFNNCFMKKIPTQTPMFIEIENGLHAEFSSEREMLLKKLKGAQRLEDKMEIKMRLKEQQKQVSGYVINVNANDVKYDFDAFYEGSEMKWCPYALTDKGIDHNTKYSYRKGWQNSDNELCCFF